MNKVIACLVLVALLIGSELQSQDVARGSLRTWKDATGEFRLEAILVRVSGDKVVLLRPEKEGIFIPLDKLSKADQQYVERRLKAPGLAKSVAETVVTLKGNSEGVTSVAFSPDGKRIVSGSPGDTLKVCDLSSLESNPFGPRATLSFKGTLAPLAGSKTTSVAFSPDGKRIVSGFAQPRIKPAVKVWNAETGELLLTLQTESVSCVAFSPDGKRIVSVGRPDGKRILGVPCSASASA